MKTFEEKWTAWLDDELSVYVRGNDNALVDGVNFSREAGWNEEDPMRGTLEVRTEDSSRPLATIPNVDIQAGKSYTFILTGTPTKVEVIQFSDSVAQDPDRDDAVPDDRAPVRSRAGMRARWPG